VVLGDAELVSFVGSEDLAVSARFYRDVLGLEVAETSAFASVYRAGGATLRVTLVEVAARAPYTVAGWTVHDIEAAVGELAPRGVAFNRYPGLEQDDAGIWRAPGGARVAWFEDPHANVLSLTEFPHR
jgi:catechol 2,3-dioxygenase-like lactoylglutathione lyase family enzyme